MQLVVLARGGVRCVYEEVIDLSSFGPLSIQRASHVEPDALAQWKADLKPVGGPTLGPFTCRSEAIAAERAWLDANWLDRPPLHRLVG